MKSLPLKYRPQQLDNLIGQKFIKTTLKNALSAKRIAPAYLFAGPRGTGKTSTARILAKSHWSQVKEIRKKSRELNNRAKLRENRQLKDFISL